PRAPWEGLIPNFFRGRFLGWSSGLAIRKSVFERAGYFQDGIAYGGDSDMWLRVAAYYPIAYSSAPKSVYHMEASNRVSEVPRMRRTLFMRRSLAQVERDREVSDYVKAEMRRYVAAYELVAAHEAHRLGYRRQARRLAALWTREYGVTAGWWFLRIKLLIPPALARLVFRSKRLVFNLEDRLRGTASP
ncbi:MAG: hypothetical protein GY953_26475, partial [bacterium]|nr:hypothetical protein [bacterium]